MLETQEWLAAYRRGPVLAAIDSMAGPSLTLDLALHGAAAAALFAALRRISGSTVFALGAALLLAVHPAFGTAIPNDARGILLTSLCASLALATAGGLSRSRDAAIALGWLLTAALCGTPGAAPACLVLSSLWNRAGYRWAALTSAAIFVLDAGIRIAAAGVEASASASAGLLSVVPFERGFDLTAMGPWFSRWLVNVDSPGFAAGLLQWAPAAIVFAVAVWARPTRLFAFLWAGGILALTVAATPRDFLHDRASALLAPTACVFWAGLFVVEPRNPRVKALTHGLYLTVFIAAALTSGARFLEAKRTEIYIGTAVAVAPRSAILGEALGQVLTARARRPETASAARMDLYRNAAEAFVRGARHARDERRFRMLTLAIDDFRRAGDFERAAGELRDAAEFATDDGRRAELAVLRFRLLVAEGDLPNALRCLRAASENFPDVKDLRRQYLLSASELLGTRARLTGTSEGSEAERQLVELEQGLTPDLRSDAPRGLRAAAHVARGRIALSRGRAVDALRDFEDAKRIDPSQADPYLGAADAYLTQNLTEGARRELEAGLKATQPYPPGNLLVSLAGVELARGAEPSQVLALLDMARQVDPTELGLNRVAASALVIQSERLLEKGDGRSAEESALAAVEEAPDFAKAHACLGLVREHQKRHDDAVLCFDKAWRIEPTESRLDKLAGALKSAAVAALLERNRVKAIDRFLALRELGSKTVDLGSGVDVLRDEARSEYNNAVDTKDPAVSRQHLERSLVLLPGNFYALYALGTLEAEAGGEEHTNDVKAIELWTRALVAAKESGIDLSSFALHLNLAQAHYRAKEDGRAHALLTEYLALGSSPYSSRCQALLEVLDMKKR